MPWSDLPFDLAFVIVSLAARQDDLTVLALTLVSNEFQDIADRVLFWDIYFRRRRLTTRMLKNMFSHYCSARLVRARAYVTSIRAPAYHDLEINLLEGALRHCVNLRILVSRNFLESALWITPPPKLKTVGTTYNNVLSRFWPPGSAQVYPLLYGITHLVVGQSIYARDTLYPLGSRLTHLSVGFYSYNIPPWTVPFPQHLQLYLVHLKFSRHPATDEDFHSIVSRSQFADIQHEGRVDGRFVVVVPFSHAKWPGSKTCGGYLVAPDWDTGNPSINSSEKMLYDWLEDGAWTAGDKIVEQRRGNRRSEGEAGVV
ncbi:hypothetical protein DL96DRAFT_1626172, partial [Flagelloscypha sp. PMI_526]